MHATLRVALGQDPWDRELRLVYADWLEEQGQLDAARRQRARATRRQRRPAGGRHADSREADGYKTTGSNAVYRKLHKRRHAACDRCPWHQGDNAGRRPGHSSWKRLRRHRWQTREA